MVAVKADRAAVTHMAKPIGVHPATVDMRPCRSLPVHSMEGSASMVRKPPRSVQSNGAREDLTTTAPSSVQTEGREARSECAQSGGKTKG